MRSEYESALARLARAHTAQDLEQLENSFTRLYNAGIFTDNEFMRLLLVSSGKRQRVTT